MASHLTQETSFAPQRHRELGRPTYAEALSTPAPSSEQQRSEARAWLYEDHFERRIDGWRNDVWLMRGEGAESSAARLPLRATSTHLRASRAQRSFCEGSDVELCSMLPPARELPQVASLRRDSSPTSGRNTSGLSSPEKLYARLGHEPSESERRAIQSAFERLTQQSDERRS